jgi:DNA-binding response OmpR family regulator
MKRQRILVVDDDPDIRSLLVELFGRAGYEVDQAAEGRAALRSMYQSPPDLIVLDVSMPDLDGWQTLERIRDLSDVPVVMLTAHTGELEKVRGLRGGADDYVTKPFGRQELLARAEALLRRSDRAPRHESGDAYADDQVSIDFAQRAVSVAGEPVSLTPLEFRLLATFVQHPNRVLSHDQLLEAVWGSVRATSRDQVKLYVGYLRRKLGPAADAVETVRGFGYRYRPARSRTGAS